MRAHAPKPEFAYPGDTFAQENRVAMPGVGANMFEELMDFVSWPLQGLQEPSSMGDQKAGYAFGSIVANRRCKDLLDILVQVRQALGGGAACIDNANEGLGFHGSPDVAVSVSRYGINRLDPVNRPVRRIAAWGGDASNAREQSSIQGGGSARSRSIIGRERPLAEIRKVSLDRA